MGCVDSVSRTPHIGSVTNVASAPCAPAKPDVANVADVTDVTGVTASMWEPPTDDGDSEPI